MAHHSRLDKIVIDVAPVDHANEVAFWSGASGQPLTQSGRHPEYHWGEIPGQDVGILVQRLDDGASRVHVDIHTTDVDAEIGASNSSAPTGAGRFTTARHAGPGPPPPASSLTEPIGSRMTTPGAGTSRGSHAGSATLTCRRHRRSRAGQHGRCGDTLPLISSGKLEKVAGSRQTTSDPSALIARS